MAKENNIGFNDDKYKCLIHLDRLSITFLHWSGSTFQDTRNPDFIVREQIYRRITLLYDNLNGLGGFYHSYKVFYDGIPVGRIHSATKLKKHEIQFDFAKEVFYAFYPDFWYDVYRSVKEELGIIYNNVMYMEISVDTNCDLINQYAFYYQNTINNKLSLGKQYKLRGKTRVHVLDNGESFILAGTDCEISIYNKSLHAEKYIIDYFSKNGLAEQNVFRIESRLKWDYIRYLRNRKKMNITVETLRDSKQLAKIFQISSANKTVFLDLENKEYDKNRNAQYKKISILDNLQIETSEIGSLNEEIRNTHYKSESVDENIVRQNYYRYLETGNKRYLQNLKSSCSVAGYNSNHILNSVIRFNFRYKGNRTQDVNRRMEYVKRWLKGSATQRLTDGLRVFAQKINNLLYGIH